MDPKFYTAFYFDLSDTGSTKISVDNLHCTHKYLGAQSPENLKQILFTIQLYFKWKRPEFPGYWMFKKLDFFDQGTIVLRGGEALFLADLREELDIYRKDEYPYNPHITVAGPGKKTKGPIDLPVGLSPMEYRLMSGDQVLETWEFST